MTGVPRHGLHARSSRRVPRKAEPTEYQYRRNQPQIGPQLFTAPLPPHCHGGYLTGGRQFAFRLDLHDVRAATADDEPGRAGCPGRRGRTNGECQGPDGVGAADVLGNPSAARPFNPRLIIGAGHLAGLVSSGASSPASAVSSISGASGKTATKGAGAAAGAVSGLTSSLTPLFGGSGATALFDMVGVGSDLAGLGGDGAGLGSDAAGLGFDGYGLSLDFAGLDSLSGADGAAASGLGPAAGLGSGASASVGQAASLGTLSVPPSWADAVSSVTPLTVLDAGAAPAGGARRGRLPVPPSPNCRWAAWSGASPTGRSADRIPRFGDSALTRGRVRAALAGCIRRPTQRPGPHTDRCAAPAVGCGVTPSWTQRRCRCSPCCCRRSAPSGRERWLARRSPGSCDPTG